LDGKFECKNQLLNQKVQILASSRIIYWGKFSSIWKQRNTSKSILHLWNQFWLLQKWNQTFT